MAQPRRAYEKKNKQPINQFIKASKVRLISAEGEQLGITSIDEAMDKAKAIEDKKLENKEKMKEWKHPR